MNFIKEVRARFAALIAQNDGKDSAAGAVRRTCTRNRGFRASRAMKTLPRTPRVALAAKSPL